MSGRMVTKACPLRYWGSVSNMSCIVSAAWFGDKTPAPATNCVVFAKALAH